MTINPVLPTLCLNKIPALLIGLAALGVVHAEGARAQQPATPQMAAPCDVLRQLIRVAHGEYRDLRQGDANWEGSTAWYHARTELKNWRCESFYQQQRRGSLRCTQEREYIASGTSEEIQAAVDAAFDREVRESYGACIGLPGMPYQVDRVSMADHTDQTSRIIEYQRRVWGGGEDVDGEPVKVKFIAARPLSPAATKTKGKVRSMAMLIIESARPIEEPFAAATTDRDCLVLKNVVESSQGNMDAFAVEESVRVVGDTRTWDARAWFGNMSCRVEAKNGARARSLHCEQRIPARADLAAQRVDVNKLAGRIANGVGKCLASPVRVDEDAAMLAALAGDSHSNTMLVDAKTENGHPSATVQIQTLFDLPAERGSTEKAHVLSLRLDRAKKSK